MAHVVIRSASVMALVLLAKRPSVAVETASVTIPIDSSWRAIGPVGDLTGQGINNVGLSWEASHIGWNTLVNYDDSDAAGWTSAIAVVHPNEPFLRYWVDGTETVGSTPAYFRKVFTISGIPLDGGLDFGVDDDAKVYVNGQLVFDDADGLATSFTDGNVTPYLHSGQNVIAIKAHDQQGAQSIAGRLDVLFRVPEPSVVGILLPAIVLFARSRRRFKRRAGSATAF